MNIALNTTPLLAPLTGIGQYIKNLAEELIASEECIAHLFTGFNWSDQMPLPISSDAISILTKIRRKIPLSYDAIRLIQEITFTLGHVKRSIDVYHEPNYLALSIKGPTVVTVHDLSFIHYPECHPPARMKAIDKYLEGSINQSTHIITDSEFIRGEVVRYLGIPGDKVTSIPLGVDKLLVPRSAAECSHVITEYDLCFHSYFILVGTIEPRKNIKTVLKAYKSLDRKLRDTCPLLIVGLYGWGVNEIDADFFDLVELGHVRCTGFVSRERLAVLIAGARCLLYPSIYEGFGLPPLEAMSCGVLPVVSNSSSLPEVVSDLGLCVDPLDVDGWALTMKDMLLDANNLGIEHKRSLINHASKFKWKDCAKKTIDVYKVAAA